MTFPTGTEISTANVDSADKDPSLARVDILNLINAVNSIISSANTAQGVLVLDGTGRVTASRLPATLAPTGNLGLQPTSGIVNVNNVLRLAQIYSSDLGSTTGTATPTAGDVVYLVDGDGGQPCLGCYDGSAWRIVRFFTTVGDVAASLAATTTLTATNEP